MILEWLEEGGGGESKDEGGVNERARERNLQCTPYRSSRKSKWTNNKNKAYQGVQKEIKLVAKPRVLYL